MKPRLQRATIYARVSTTDQRTALQLDEARALVERRGWALIDTFRDEGVSGAKERRPELDRMLASARRGRFDVLVVWRADRLFRSVRQMVNTLTELQARRIDFVSCTEPFDTSTPAGQLLFHVSAAFAQFERDVLVERTLAGMAAARRRGVAIGRPRVHVDLTAARALLDAGSSTIEAARALGVGYGTLRRALLQGAPRDVSTLGT